MQGSRLLAALLATGIGSAAATVAVVRVGSEPNAVEISTIGIQGERGPEGEQGPRGIAGMRGVDGLPGERGERGASGSRGPRGVRGTPGRQGLVGERGAVGETGATGGAGVAGPSGATGPAGATGPTGATGAPGATGPTGPTGATGAKGDAGGFGAYGSFYDTTDVPLTLDQATPVPLGQTDFASGVSIVNGNEITIAQTGRYSIAFSIQLEKTDAGTDWVSLWLRKNGTNVPWTNTDVAVSDSDANSRTVVAWNFFVEATTVGDHWQLMIASTTSATGKMLIQSVDPQTNPIRPAIPGTILTVNQVG